MPVCRPRLGRPTRRSARGCWFDGADPRRHGARPRHGGPRRGRPRRAGPRARRGARGELGTQGPDVLVVRQATPAAGGGRALGRHLGGDRPSAGRRRAVVARPGGRGRAPHRPDPRGSQRGQRWRRDGDHPADLHPRRPRPRARRGDRAGASTCGVGGAPAPCPGPVRHRRPRRRCGRGRPVRRPRRARAPGPADRRGLADPRARLRRRLGRARRPRRTRGQRRAVVRTPRRPHRVGEPPREHLLLHGTHDGGPRGTRDGTVSGAPSAPRPPFPSSSSRAAAATWPPRAGRVPTSTPSPPAAR